MSLFASGADRLSAKVIGTYQALNHAFRRRRDYAQAWISLGDTLSKLAVGEVPQLAQPASDLAKLFSELGEVHQELSLSEERNCENVRDVIERFVVVYNASEAYSSIHELYSVAARNLRLHREKMEMQSTRPDYEVIRPKLEQEQKVLLEKQYTLLLKFKPALYRNIVQREKYIIFKARKFKDGFSQYAVALKTAAQKEIEIFERIKELLLTFETALPPEVEDAIAEAVQEPAPAAVSAEALQGIADEVDLPREPEPTPIAQSARDADDSPFFEDA
jgi:hypothetical protein